MYVYIYIYIDIYIYKYICMCMCVCTYIDKFSRESAFLLLRLQAATGVSLKECAALVAAIRTNAAQIHRKGSKAGCALSVSHIYIYIYIYIYI